MKFIKKYFKNRKTLKYKSLIFWGYIFLTYLILRPSDRDLSTHVVINENFKDFYVKFPEIIYSIILVAILVEFIKLLKKNLFNLFHIFIIAPLLILGTAFYPF
tara:strand:+ start:142 stop:450 length:309 start_codon:yes stop_codon:yes gene_type:complete